ncbi:Rap1a/Tai family immunity protein [Mesorhizobium sp.]|uniref:Rap1a/Tai family immunity protein n=1 Tax=Mesorhizobium sp. TaxID=1871066 RepID=UPI0034380777
MTRWRLATLIILTCPSAANAQNSTRFLSGNELYDSCTQKSSHSIGYVEGVVDADLSATLGYCIPVGVRADQMRDVVCRFLEAHPESRQEGAQNLVRGAFIQVWPCK